MLPKNSVVRARDRAGPSFSRSILAFGAAAPTAVAVSGDPEQLRHRLPEPCTVNCKVYCLRNDLGGPWLTVELPAPTRIALTLDMGLHTLAPSYDTPFGGDRLGRA